MFDRSTGRPPAWKNPPLFSFPSSPLRNLRVLNLMAHGQWRCDPIEASRGGIVSDPDAALGLPLAGCFWIARLGLQGDFPHPSGEHSELKSIPVAIFDA